MVPRAPRLALWALPPLSLLGCVLSCAEPRETCWEVTTLHGPPAPEERFERQRSLATGEVVLSRHLLGETLLDEEVTLPSPGGHLRWRRWGASEPRAARLEIREGARRSGYEDNDGDGVPEHRWSTLDEGEHTLATDHFDDDDDGVADRTEERRVGPGGRLLHERTHDRRGARARTPVYDKDGAWLGERLDEDGDGRTDDVRQVITREGPGWELTETVNAAGRALSRARRERRQERGRVLTTDRFDDDGDGRWDRRFTTSRDDDATLVEEDTDGDGRVDRRLREERTERGALRREVWTRGPPHDVLDTEERDEAGRLLRQTRHRSGAAGWIHQRSLSQTFGPWGLASVDVDEGPERSLAHRVSLQHDERGAPAGARDAATARAVRVIHQGDCPGRAPWLDAEVLLRFLEVPRGL